MSTKEGKKSFVLDAALILAGVTGLIYYAHFIYLYYYYDFFGVQLVDLHYSLQQITMVNPSIVLGLIIFIGGAVLVWRHMESTQVKPFEIRSWWLQSVIVIAGILICLFVITFLSFLVKNVARIQAVKFANASQSVLIELKTKNITGYRYLARSDDCFYFFKIDADGKLLPLVVKAEEVREISSD